MSKVQHLGFEFQEMGHQVTNPCKYSPSRSEDRDSNFLHVPQLHIHMQAGTK